VVGKLCAHASDTVFNFPLLPLCYFSGISLELSRFEFLNTVFVYHCPNLKFLTLRFCHCVNFQGCSEGMVRSLHHLRHFCVSDCPDLQDLQYFGNAPSLFLDNCKNLISLEGLNRNTVHFIMMSCIREVRCYPFLQGVFHVELANTSVSSTDLVYLKETHRLELVNCKNITSLRFLGKVPILHVKFYHNLSNIDDSETNKIVGIYSCSMIYEKYIAGKYESIKNKTGSFVVEKDLSERFIFIKK
jgi:hypothetical protein